MISWRSGFVRLAVIMSVLPALIMTGMGMLSLRQTQAQLQQEIQNQINDDIAALVEIYTDESTSGLIAAVEARLAMVPSAREKSYYTLLSFDQTVLAGNIITPASDIQSRSTPLRGGEILTVGRSLSSVQETLAGLKSLFTLGILMSIGLGLIAGLVSAYGFHRRLKRINDVCERVADGHINARITPEYSRDEVSDLSDNVNMMLGRIQKLIALRKGVSDQVAHELRTPLTRLDAALIKAADALETPEAIEAARKDVKDCVSLLDALLDVSALESQHGDRQGFEPIDVSKIVQNLCEFYEALADEKSQTLTVKSTDPAWIMGDSLQISRLLANLIDNAIKYTPEQGRITVDAQVSGETVILSVADTGPGIAADMTANIFMPFFRSGAATQARGHGLGLALAKAIVDRHRGTISVNPASTATGTVFKIEFDKV